jgi:hypothetical protein
MRLQRTIFARTRPEPGLITRGWRHGGRMITCLSVLVLLGVAGPAAALQFDSYSVSALIEPNPDFPFQTLASVTATAPGFSLSLGFDSSQEFLPGFNVVRIGCPSPDGPPIPCRPGESVSANAFTQGGSDTSNGIASIVLAGQSILPCTLSLRPREGGTLCATPTGAFLSWGSALLPKFAGPPPGHPVPDVPADLLNVTTVASTFSAFFAGASIWQTLPGSFPTQIDSVGFTGTGPGQIDLMWQSDTGTWLPLFAEGRIDVLAPTPTPEPATFLLFATTGAGLGLARWRRRRSRERVHAV